MLGKEVIVYRKDGLWEGIICTEFKIGMDRGVAAMMFRIPMLQQIYVIPLEKIDRFDVHHIWIFDEGFLPPDEDHEPAL